jgi:hypothetical protein
LVVNEKQKANAILKSPPLPALSSTKSVEERAGRGGLFNIAFIY